MKPELKGLYRDILVRQRIPIMMQEVTDNEYLVATYIKGKAPPKISDYLACIMWDSDQYYQEDYRFYILIP